MTKIISTHSYRGGTGKSNVTANIAAALALRGHKVGIVDTDIQSPGIHTLFKMDLNTVHNTLNNFLWGHCRMVEAAHDVTAGVVDGNGAQILGEAGQLFLVPSSIKTGEIARILKEKYNVEDLNRGFIELCDSLDLDYLLIDTHPGVNEETLLSIAISDTLLLILRPDIQDYQGTAVTLELARKLEVPQLFLVVNKALDTFDFQDLSQRIFSNYRTPVVAVLPLTTELIQIGSTGLIRTLQPNHSFTLAIESIVDAIE
ncbi:MinD-like ATPase involved in chromosome partitioning or flagellar assembly [Roseibium hamelinense]|uniref:MinD-like ATPase involved in chromosome partitioning or flagellar assembly n=1 Tax=Roseibium hamelinense TaxID=150831 RepID=A0A562SEG5_9HYPH|nr:MinD/ParA family protein [Roseibium hamelinense]MTI42553.1 MinD/ParA family protein [Roseibium hamelinense]TWI79568.1 MinD-like ATPase involved in chromosome partitioning or flagellar assembly [Roseibium hamelinense]